MNDVLKTRTTRTRARVTTKDLREANENIRKAQDEETDGHPVDPKKTGNKPRFDRDR